MIRALLVLIVGLGLPGVLPALAVVRRSPAVIFLAPLIGSAMAAIAAELVLGVGSTLVVWYVVVAVIVNVAAAVWCLAARTPEGEANTWTWFVLTAVVMLGALLVPLTGLRASLLGYDANVIWLTHALMVSGGHHALVSGLRNPAYAFSNPDYPPLVPAVGALAFAFFGRTDLHIAVVMTVLLNACALGAVGVGVAAMGRKALPRQQFLAIVAGGAVCLVGFSVAGGYAVDGYADLLWSAAALGAVVWGLVLPRSNRALVTAWVCAIVASLTKNEGLTTALIVLVLIGLRYRPPSLPRLRRSLGHCEESGVVADPWTKTARERVERASFVVVPALPGLAWIALVRHIGLSDAFFGSSSTESPATRLGPAVTGIASHLAVGIVALLILVAGCTFLRRDRDRDGLGHPAWLWVACFSYLVLLLATYVFGSPEIHWWLATSVYRTTIFPQVALYTDIAIWLLIALGTTTTASPTTVLPVSDADIEPSLT
jgi:hypothetical protein